MDYQSLPEYVKQTRKRYRLTQLELSEKVGVGLRIVRELEQGEVSLRMNKVNLVLQLFGAKLASFRINQNP